MKKILFLSVLLFLSALTLNYAKEYNTIMSRDLGFVNVTEFEFTTGITKFKKSNAVPDVGYVPFKLVYGIMQNYELCIELPYLFVVSKNTDGQGDLKLSQQFKFVEESADMPSFVGGLGLEFPLSDNDLNELKMPSYTNNKVDFELYVGAGKKIPKLKNIYLSIDAGVNFIGGGDETEFDLNLSASKELSKKIKVIGEFNSRKIDDFKSFTFTPGICIRPLDTLNIKLGCPIGTGSDAYDYGFILNITNIF